MTFPKARLAVAVALFVGWLGFLLYLVVDSRTVVLSKPQFMNGQVYVVATMDQGNSGDYLCEFTINEVLWSEDPADRKLNGRKVQLPFMVEFDRWGGNMQYLMPLHKTAAGTFELAVVPRLDPRQAPTHATIEASGLFSTRVRRRLPLLEARELQREWEAAGFTPLLTPEWLRVYPWTPDTRAQVERIIAGK